MTGGPKRLLLWAAGLAIALWALHIGVAGTLAAPPTAPGSWGGWVRDVGADVAIAAILRIIAIALCWYLTVATIVGSLAHHTAAPTTVALVDRALPGFLRTMLGATATGLSITAAGLTASTGPLLFSGASATSAPATAQVAGAAIGEALPQEPATATLRETSAPDQNLPSGPTAPAAATLAPFTLALAPIEAGALTTPPPDPNEPGTWLTEPGDHLWSIAAETLAELLGEQPTDRQTDRYWRAVIGANRDRLVDPANPDLILPGQDFVLPPFSGGGTEAVPPQTPGV